jgi:glucose-1-phosphate thymidylyltransferase
MRKGIILAGGAGTRLKPITDIVCKQLLPIYDKPLFYYPLSTLMLAGIREVLFISTPKDLEKFSERLGEGSQLGMKLSYSVQCEPKGLAEAFLIADRDGFLKKNDTSCLVLGDNIFYGHGLTDLLKEASENERDATIFAKKVRDPKRFGVVEFNSRGRAISIEEKPEKPKSDYAVTGLYFYPKDAVGAVSKLKPSARGELEITDLNREYLHAGKLDAKKLGMGFAWFDTGTNASMLKAASFIATIQEEQMCQIACLEEIAYNFKWINKEQLRKAAEPMKNSDYGKYILGLL